MFVCVRGVMRVSSRNRSSLCYACSRRSGRSRVQQQRVVRCNALTITDLRKNVLKRIQTRSRKDEILESIVALELAVEDTDNREVSLSDASVDGLSGRWNLLYSTMVKNDTRRKDKEGALHLEKTPFEILLAIVYKVIIN